MPIDYVVALIWRDFISIIHFELVIFNKLLTVLNRIIRFLFFRVDNELQDHVPTIQTIVYKEFVVNYTF